jgi:hypothetical protein
MNLMYINPYPTAFPYGNAVIRERGRIRVNLYQSTYVI